MKTLQEKALEAHRRKVEASEFQIFKEVEELKKEIAALRKAAEKLAGKVDQAAVDFARKLDPRTVARAEAAAEKAIGRSFQVRQGANRVAGKITACQFAGFSGRKVLWLVTVKHEKGATITGFFDALPR